MVRAPGGTQRAHLEYAEDGWDRHFLSPFSPVLNGKIRAKGLRSRYEIE